MKKLWVAIVVTAFGLAPAMGTACDLGMDESSASAAPPEQLASVPAPAASKVPAPATAKTFAPTATKQAVAKTKAPVPDQKVAAGTTN